MLAQLAQTKHPAEQSKLLATLISQAQTRLPEYLAELNPQLIQNIIGSLAAENFNQWAQLSLSLLSVQECYEYVGNGASTPTLQLLSHVGQLPIENKHEKLTLLESSEMPLEKQLVLHKLFSKYSTSNLDEGHIGRVLPCFLRVTSLIMEKYFRLAQEKSQDRVEEEEPVAKNCQVWVASNIKEFFSGLKAPDLDVNRKILLQGIGDLTGALLELEQQSAIKQPEAYDLLHNCMFGYCRANYTWNEIHSFFLSSLRSKKFSNPYSRIEIPEKYTEAKLLGLGFNTQAFVYLSLQFLQKGLATISSRAELLRLLVPAVGQSRARHLKIKAVALEIFDNLLKSEGKVQVKSGMQSGYPIQLLLFYLYNFEPAFYEEHRAKFEFTEKQTQATSLAVLNQLQLVGLHNEKAKYILHCIKTDQLEGHPAVKLIVGKLKNDQLKPEVQTLLTEVEGKSKQLQKAS